MLCRREACARPAAAALSYRWADHHVIIVAAKTPDPALYPVCDPCADELEVDADWHVVDRRG